MDIEEEMGIEKDKLQKLPSPPVWSCNDWREGIKGRGIMKVIRHPHPCRSPELTTKPSPIKGEGETDRVNVCFGGR